MEFTPSDDQEALRGAVRDFLSRECPSSRVRDVADDVSAIERLWDKVVDLGWAGMLIPEAHGGLGLGLVDVAMVMEEMGRVPFPGPFLSSAVLATLAARALDLDDRLAS